MYVHNIRIYMSHIINYSPTEWHLIFLSCTIECDVPVHVNDHHVQRDVALLVATHYILK